MNVFLRLARTSLVLACLAAPVQAKAADWVYMDLGEVIVTGNPTDGYTYVPGALDFLQNLRDAGLKLSLLSNIPEAWGATCDLKFTMLRQFLGSRLHEPDAFEWTRFDGIALPPFDRYRKPHQFMFVNALHHACPDRALFIGENANEIAVAKGLGMATHTIVEGAALPTVAEIEHLLDNEFTFHQPEACAFDGLYSHILQPADVGHVTGCIATPSN